MNRVQVHKDSGVTLPPPMIENPGYADGRRGAFMTAPDQMVETMRPRSHNVLPIKTSANMTYRRTVETVRDD